MKAIFDLLTRLLGLGHKRHAQGEVMCERLCSIDGHLAVIEANSIIAVATIKDILAELRVGDNGGSSGGSGLSPADRATIVGETASMQSSASALSDATVAAEPPAEPQPS